MESLFIMQTKISGKKIIITGASSGIGERLTWHIAKNGGIPIILARSINKLEKIKEQIEKQFSVECYVYKVDLEHRKDRTQVIANILTEHQKIQGLINNAGIGIFEDVMHMNEEDIERMFQLNVHALIQITKQILPYFATLEGEAHIINIASQAGKLATPKAAIYSATKHAVLGFTNGLRQELTDSKIEVTAVNLGPVQTNFFLSADPDGTYQKNVQKYILDPDQVAQKIIRYLFVKKREINLPWWMDAGSRLYQVLPGPMERVLKKQLAKK
nr:SDR family oxidoreductase [Priestia megaterium]